MNKKIKYILLLLILVFLIIFLINNNNSKKKIIEPTTTIDQNIDVVKDNTLETDSTIEDPDHLIDSLPIIDSEEKFYYFGYGSNMDIDLLRRRIGNNTIIPVSYGLLENYRLIFPRGVGSVIPDDNYAVYGCVFLLTQEELKKLDVVEGYREDRERSLNSYNRDPIEIILPNTEKIIADIYIQVKDTEDLPSSNYKQTIIKGANDCNLPREYIDWLENIETR